MLYGPPCLGSPGLFLDRWLDLDLLRSAGGVRPSAAAAVEPDASSSRVGIGDVLVALPRPAGLFVGLPVIVWLTHSVGRNFDFTLKINYHVGWLPNYVVFSHISPLFSLYLKKRIINVLTRRVWILLCR